MSRYYLFADGEDWTLQNPGVIAHSAFALT
jgi:hypothetical protein